MQDSALKRSLVSQSVRTVLFGSSVAVGVAMGGVAQAADSGEVSVLKDQVRILMERINELENSQQQASVERQELREEFYAPANFITAGDEPGSFKLPGSDTTVTVGGYVKGDLIYDLDADVGDSFSVAAIPTGDVDDDNHIRLHAKQSRFRIRSNTELGNGGAINTTIEGDFEGGQGNQDFSNSDRFRMRHAFGSYDTASGNILIGQTWTLFGGFEYAATVDFFAPNGQVFKRQSQIRWSHPSGFAISIENPESAPTGALASGEARGGAGRDELPDLVVAWSGGPGGAGGSYNASAVFRQLGVEGVTAAGVAVDDEEFGYGLHVGGTWDFDSIMFTAGFTYGDGVGSYILSNGSFNNDVFVGLDGSLETIESWSFTTGLTIRTSDASSINISTGYFENDEPAMSSGVEDGFSIHANYMWSPWPGTNFGIEVIHGDQTLADGSDGDATRLQFGAQRSF